jgi:hypothetical protein
MARLKTYNILRDAQTNDADQFSRAASGSSR